MNSIKRFELDANQIKIKDIVKKRFLELEIWAISDIDPNRNESHFTLESLENVLPNCKNTPILGYFERGDFVSHNGKMEYDKELENVFWNTEHGERILGWVRESDPVEIVEKNGLHWLKIRCVLCVAYAYNQVKRLLKDKTKKVSVEITVHNSTVREDGIEVIKDFTLNGITILGSQNGRPVVEGIPDAHLSLIEKMSEGVFAEQRKVLSFAYQSLSGENDTEFNAKEGNAETMDNETREEIEKEDVSEEVKFEETAPAEEPEKECGGKCAAEEEEHECGDCEEPCDDGCVEEECGTKCSEDPECPEGECPEEGEPEEECGDKNLCGDSEVKAPEDNYEANTNEMLSALQEENAKLQRELDECKSKLEEFEAIRNRMEIAEAAIEARRRSDLKAYAIGKMATEIIDKKYFDDISLKCENGEYTDNNAIDRDIAYAIYCSRPTNKEKLSTPITVEAPTREEEESKNLSRSERMALRLSKIKKN